MASADEMRDIAEGAGAATTSQPPESAWPGENCSRDSGDVGKIPKGAGAVKCRVIDPWCV